MRRSVLSALASLALSGLVAPACVGDEPPIPATDGGATDSGPEETGSDDGTTGDSSSGDSGSPDSGGQDGAPESGPRDSGGDGATCDGGTVCGSTCTDLTSDGKNCGACGHDCLGGQCSSSVCQPVVLSSLSQTGAFFGHIATDGTTVAWSQTGAASVGGGVYWVKAAGGANQKANTLASQANVYDGIGPITINGGNVYWTEVTSTSSFSYVYKGNPSTKAITKITTLLNGSVGYGIVVSPNGLSVAFLVHDSGNSSLGLDYCSTTSGGGCTTVLSEGNQSLPPGGLATDGANLYWTENGSTVMEAPFIQNATASSIAKGQSTPGTIIYWANAVYWGDAPGLNGLWTSPVPTPSPALVPYKGGAAVNAIAADTKSLYYSLLGKGFIYQMPLAGSTSPTTLVSGKAIVDLAVVGKVLYWLDQTAHTVNALAM